MVERNNTVPARMQEGQRPERQHHRGVMCFQEIEPWPPLRSPLTSCTAPAWSAPAHFRMAFFSATVAGCSSGAQRSNRSWATTNLMISPRRLALPGRKGDRGGGGNRIGHFCIGHFRFPQQRCIRGNLAQPFRGVGGVSLKVLTHRLFASVLAPSRPPLMHPPSLHPPARDVPCPLFPHCPGSLMHPPVTPRASAALMRVLESRARTARLCSPPPGEVEPGAASAGVTAGPSTPGLGRKAYRPQQAAGTRASPRESVARAMSARPVARAMAAPEECSKSYKGILVWE